MAPPLAARTFTALGTVVSISAPMAADELDAAVETARRVFRDAEEVFAGGGRGLAGRLADGTMELRHAPRRMRSLYAEVVRWRHALGNVVAPVAVRPAWGIPAMAKGWAIAHTGQAMMDLQLPHWAVAARGDVLCSGSPFPAQPSSLDPFYGTGWRAGITDPARPGGLLADVPLAGTPGFTAALATAARTAARTPGSPGSPGTGGTSGACAASGASGASGTCAASGASMAYGASGTSSGAGGFRQVSVLAEDILAADVLSGAILVGGESVLEAAAREFGVEVLVVGNGPDPGGTLLATAGWPTYRPAASSAHQAAPGSARDARAARADGR